MQTQELVVGLGRGELSLGPSSTSYAAVLRSKLSSQVPDVAQLALLLLSSRTALLVGRRIIGSPAEKYAEQSLTRAIELFGV